jgi:elongation factor P--(R)-beta-lysine ligase
MLGLVRQFFKDRNILEVDCPLLNKGFVVDAHIDLMEVKYLTLQKTYYLHSSPELMMKKLLMEGMGDIYQLAHVMRDGEKGALHNPEFTLIEWYRLNISFEEMIAETIEAIMLFLEHISVEIEMLSYREAFLRYAGFDYLDVDLPFLKNRAQEKGLFCAFPQEEESKDAYLNILIAHEVEPHLGKEKLTVLYHYPATQAALAATSFVDKEAVSKRFEVYYKAIELANGYQELQDGRQVKKRMEEANSLRIKMGKEAYPLDEKFFQGALPSCCGVAVGFDRLLMLHVKQKTIQSVLPFAMDCL